MHALSSDYDIQDFEPSVQQFAPMIENLTANERFALVKLIMDMPFLKSEKKLAPLDVKYFDVVHISDDFDEDLGDDFWLGDDK